MKKLIEEVEGEGFVGLLGQTVTLFCGVYIYTGKLTGVNDSFVKLEDAKVVYETGPFNEKQWKRAEDIAPVWYVQTQAIESFGLLK